MGRVTGEDLSNGTVPLVSRYFPLVQAGATGYVTANSES